MACLTHRLLYMPSSAIADTASGGLKERAARLVDCARELLDALGSMDFSAALQKACDVADLAAGLRDELGGGMWSVAGFIPVLGGDVRSAKELMDILVDLSNDALIPLCEALVAAPPDTLVSSDGDGTVAFDLAALQTLLDAVRDVLPAVARGLDRLEAIGDLHVDELSQALEQVRAMAGSVRRKFEVIELFVDRLPRLLGSDGPRCYLLVAQTNCELRSTGGFPGFMGFVRVEGGVCVKDDFTSMYDIMPYDPNLGLPISDEESALFGRDVSWYAGIMNFIPHFPRVCELWSQARAAVSRDAIDGIVALDPVFLQNVLAQYGEVEMSDGTVVDGTNAAQVFMNDVYLRFTDDNQMQDAFFSEAAQAVFDRIVGNPMDCDLPGLVRTVDDGMDRRRLTVWMADDGDQALFQRLGCTGELNQDPLRPRAGIYFGNETWGKIDWWLTATLEATEAGASVPLDLTDRAKKQVDRAGGAVHVLMTLKNTLRWSEVVSNEWVFGKGPLRRCDGDMVTRVWLYAPKDGTIENLTVGGSDALREDVGFRETRHMDLQVLFGIVQLLPGESVVIEYDVSCSDAALEPLVFDMTPLCRD